jgi:3-oxoadipate enol-lactonase
MKTRANGLQIHYTIDGNGPWLTMSHSLACDSRMWDEQ